MLKIQDAYMLGMTRKGLELTSVEYDAWPKGLVKCGPSMADDLLNMTHEVRAIAEQKAGEVEIPENFLEKIAFNIGYILGPPLIVKNFMTSNGPLNPFTGRAIYQAN